MNRLLNCCNSSTTTIDTQPLLSNSSSQTENMYAKRVYQGCQLAIGSIGIALGVDAANDDFDLGTPGKIVLSFAIPVIAVIGHVANRYVTPQVVPHDEEKGIGANQDGHIQHKSNNNSNGGAGGTSNVDNSFTAQPLLAVTSSTEIKKLHSVLTKLLEKLASSNEIFHSVAGAYAEPTETDALTGSYRTLKEKIDSAKQSLSNTNTTEVDETLFESVLSEFAKFGAQISLIAERSHAELIDQSGMKTPDQQFGDDGDETGASRSRADLSKISPYSKSSHTTSASNKTGSSAISTTNLMKGMSESILKNLLSDFQTALAGIEESKHIAFATTDAGLNVQISLDTPNEEIATLPKQIHDILAKLKAAAASSDTNSNGNIDE